MGGQSVKSHQQTFWDTDSAIGSQALQAGQKPCELQGTAVQTGYGQPQCLVNRFRVPVNITVRKMNDTSGQNSTVSLASVALQSLLENNLRARMDVNGSMEYRLIWKSWGMQSGRQICALRGSARRISGSESIGALFGWPTPNTMPDAPNMSQNRGDGVRNRETPQSVKGLVGWPTPIVNDSRGGRNSTAVRSNPNSKHHDGMTLVDAVSLTGWPTPRTVTGGAESAERKQELGRTVSGGSDLQAVAQLTGWGTPRVTTNGGQGSVNRATDGKARLEDQIQGLTGWVTPSARDYKDTPGMSQTGINPDGSERTRLDQLPRQVHGLISGSSDALTASTGVLAPQMSRWLQGFPEAWDRLSPGYKEWQSVQDAIVSAG